MASIDNLQELFISYGRFFTVIYLLSTFSLFRLELVITKNFNNYI